MGRLFFAIWPQPAVARQLVRVGESLAGLAGGNAMPVEKIHMTLAFLGALDEEHTAAAALAASPLKSPEIRMIIDGVGSFRRAKVGWVAPSQPVENLTRLQSQLADRLRERGFTLEDRAFTPHVTLVRKLARPVPRAPMSPVEWTSRALTLVETTGNGRYEIRQSWGLQAS
jgi:2'-5' RNA ligase